MKQKLLLKTMLLLCALVAGSSSVWAVEFEWSLNALYQNSTLVTAKTVCTTTDQTLSFTDKDGNFSLSVTRKSGNQPGFYTSSGYFRLYNTDIVEIAALNGAVITKIVVTPNGSTSVGVTADGWSSDTKTWSGSASNVKLTGSATNKWDKITITYLMPPTLSVKAGEFNSAFGLTVTAETGCTLKYTTDGTVPSTSGTAVSVASNTTTISIPAATTRVRAVTEKDGKYSAEADATYTYVDASVPNANVSVEALDFGEVEVGDPKDLTFTITPANLTGNLTIDCDNDKYDISPKTILQATTTEQTITVTADPTAWDDDMDATITISGGGITSKTVTLTASPYQVANVTLVASESKGYFKQAGSVVTSITSRVGNNVTVNAIPYDGCVFNSWTATGATPASSTDAETEFTLNSTDVTLTASFDFEPISAYVFDFTDDAWGFPTDYEKSEKSYTKDGYTFTIGATSADGHKALITSNTQVGLIFGKDGAQITFPTFSFDVKKIKVYGRSGAASGVKFNIFVNDEAICDEVTGSHVDHEFTIPVTKQSAGTVYVLKLTTKDKNAQIAKIEIIGDAEQVTVSDAKYATYCSVNKLNFNGTGIQVFKAASDGTKVNLTEIVDGIVPANTGVVLYSASAISKAIPFTDAAPSDDFSGNELVGINFRSVVNATESTKTNYILSNEASGVGFYKATDGKYLGAHKAYLSTANTPSAPEFLAFDFNNETTGVNEVKTTKAAGEFFDLQGRKVVNPTKGLYIVNGKKVVVR